MDDVAAMARHSLDVLREARMPPGRFARTGEVHISRALIDHALDREPQAHVFYSDHAAWLDMSKKLPACGGDSGTDPMGEEV